MSGPTAKDVALMERAIARRDKIIRNQAIDDCLCLMAKWFFLTNKDAKACVAEMRALKGSK